HARGVAGQGVEEAWTRGSDWDGRVTYLSTSGGRESVPLAVEQAIRAEALAEDAEGHDMHCENEARATAAEAERDRLREALEKASRRLQIVGQRYDAEQARRALAGESTGAGEGE